MSNLLSANFYRLWRSKAFWGGVAATFAVTLGAICLSLYASPKATLHWDQSILHYFYVPLFTVAAFAAAFLGTEYSENTMRNKLIVGKTRARIYLANLITVTAGGLIIAAVGQIAPVAVAVYTGKECISVSAESLAVGIIVCVCAVIGACAFFTLVGMTVTKKSTAVVITLILMIGAYTVAPKIKEKLDVPQSYPVSVWSIDGELEGEYEEPNPEAITGFARGVLETVYNILPFGAVEQAHRETAPRGFLPLYALGGFAVMTGIGAVVFRKKDLK